MTMESRLGRLEEDMNTLKMTSRRLIERTTHMDAAVSPGGWISEAFDEVHTRLDSIDRRIDSIEDRLNELIELLGLILSRLSPDNGNSQQE